MFVLEENRQQLQASYDGVLFNPHSEIVLAGEYTESSVFVGNRVSVKCPSKYQSLEVENPYGDIPYGG